MTSLDRRGGLVARTDVAILGELGEKLGSFPPTIACIEANNTVTIATIARISQALGPKLELELPG